MHIAYVNSEKVKRAPHAQGESMNTSHVQKRTPPLGSGEGPGAIVHPVHPHEDDPHDGAGADPYDAVSYRHGEAWCNRHDEPAETCSCGRKYTLAHTVAVLFVACVILAAAVEMWRAIAG